MFEIYLRRHDDGRTESVTRGLAPDAAVTEYKQILARDDLEGKPWAAVLRDDIHRCTLLFSRFDRPQQRLLPTDNIDPLALALRSQEGAEGADVLTQSIILARTRPAGFASAFWRHRAAAVHRLARALARHPIMATR